MTLIAFCLSLFLRSAFPLSPLQPFLRHQKRGAPTAGYTLTHTDEFVDQLLTEERVCDIILPRLTKRDVLEETEGLAPRSSALLKAMEESGSEDEEGARGGRKRRSNGSERDSSSSRSRRGSDSANNIRSGSEQGRFVSRSPSRSRSRTPQSRGSSPTGSATRYRSRSRDISPDRMQED